MNTPTEKELDALALPLIHAVHNGLRGYEGTRLAEKPGSLTLLDIPDASHVCV